MVCFRYVILNTKHKGDNKDDYGGGCDDDDFDDDDTKLSSSSSSVGPVANATDALQPSRLIVFTLNPPRLFGCSHV